MTYNNLTNHLHNKHEFGGQPSQMRNVEPGMRNENNSALHTPHSALQRGGVLSHKLGCKASTKWSQYHKP